MAPRDRHGRAARSDSDRRRRPATGFRARDVRRFRQIVEDAVDTLPEQLASPLDSADLVIVDIPPRSGDPVDLASFQPAATPPLLTVYRRPLEMRAESRLELEEVVRIAVGEAVARALGITDIDDLFDDDL